MKRIILETAAPEIADYSVVAVNSSYTFPQLAWNLNRDIFANWKFANFPELINNHKFDDLEYYVLSNKAEFDIEVWLLSNNYNTKPFIKMNPLPRYLLVMYGEEKEVWWSDIKEILLSKHYISWMLELVDEKYNKSKWLPELQPAETITDHIEKCIKETITKQKSLQQ